MPDLPNPLRRVVACRHRLERVQVRLAPLVCEGGGLRLRGRGQPADHVVLGAEGEEPQREGRRLRRAQRPRRLRRRLGLDRVAREEASRVAPGEGVVLPARAVELPGARDVSSY